MFRYRLEFVILDIGKQPSRKLHGAKALIRESVVGKYKPDLVIDKPHIESRIVCDEDGVTDKLEEVVRNFGKTRGVRDHSIIDAGKSGNERRDRCLRIYERLKGIEDLKALYSESADLGYAVRLFCACGLEIEHNELGIFDLTRQEIVGQENDGIIAEFKPRIAFDEIADEQLCHQRVGTADLHYEVHDADGRCPAIKGAQQRDRLVY